MRGALTLATCLFVAASVADAASLRGASVSCSPPPGLYQGSMSYTGLKPGSRATYKCMSGTYMVGGSSITCTSNGVWSGDAPDCRVKYDKKKDNSFKNNDPGYKLYSG